MHWYGGSITEAVTVCKQKNAIFVVFVEGDNEMSVEMASMLDNAAILERLSNNKNFLAIKLKSGSVDYTHFAQIYQFVPVPSLFFIGNNGTPLEVVCGGVQPDNLATRIDRILDEHQKLTPPSVQPSTSSQSIKRQTADLLQSESKASSSSNANVVDTVAKAQQSAVVMPALTVNKPRVDEDKLKTSDVSEEVETKSFSTTAVDTEKDYKTGDDGTPLEENSDGVQLVFYIGDDGTPLDDEESVPLLSAAYGRQIVPSPLYRLYRPTAAMKAAEHRLSLSSAHLSSPATKIQRTEEANDKAGDKHEIVCVGDVCYKRPKTGDPGPSSQSSAAPQKQGSGEVQVVQDEPESQTTIDEKLERAQNLIEAKRREKEEKERELEKQKELQRRSTGQGVVELKRWQHEQELKQIQEERKREKMENNLARQRILEQIAQDRAERRAREAPPPAPASPTPIAPPAATPGDGSGGARLQFKLPEGASHMAQFQSDDTIATVRKHLADTLKLPMEGLSLWTAFPRRELTDFDATLRQLQLAPSAALLVLPRRTAAPSAPASVSAFNSFMSLFSTMFATLILNPTTQVLAWLRSFIPGGGAASGGSPVGDTRANVGGSRAGTQAPSAVPVRRRGNIHRLPGDAPPDDDNNTWNGNSTQQM